jgi:tRNA(fMet)-specific endonuclease VapC
LSYIAKAQNVDAQVDAYSQLKLHLESYLNIPVIEYDRKSALEFQRLRKLYPRLGTMDLKIAAITIVNNAMLLTRNISDFSKIAGLQFQDWTV